MISLKESCKKFYGEHESFLKKNYPGISEYYFWNEAKELAEYACYTELELTQSLFFHDQLKPLKIFFSHVLKGRPFAYIKERTFFYKNEFIVDQNVLIPRFETEILVEKACHFLQKNKHKKKEQSFIDIGTGSGVILLSLLMELDFQVTGWGSDISRKALEVAKKNYSLHKKSIKSSSKVEFYCSDRLQGISKQFDLIVTNPPYIKSHLNSADVHHQVLKYEPELALFIQDEDYEEWFDELFKQSERALVANGKFLMEGHEKHLNQLAILMNKRQFQNIVIENDYTGRPRFLSATKK